MHPFDPLGTRDGDNIAPLRQHPGQRHLPRGTAFLCSQLLDVSIFWLFHKATGGKKLWLRATGSTAVSQVIDTFIVLGIGFWLPGKIATKDFLNLAFTNYTYKFGIAIALTPLIYLAHNAIERYLGTSHHAYTPPNPQVIEG